MPCRLATAPYVQVISHATNTERIDNIIAHIAALTSSELTRGCAVARKSCATLRAPYESADNVPPPGTHELSLVTLLRMANTSDCKHT